MGEHTMIRKLGKYGKENNLLATSSSTWQTEDYFFNKKILFKDLKSQGNTMEARTLYLK